MELFLFKTATLGKSMSCIQWRSINYLEAPMKGISPWKSFEENDNNWKSPGKLTSETIECALLSESESKIVLINLEQCSGIEIPSVSNINRADVLTLFTSIALNKPVNVTAIHKKSKSII